MRKRRQRSCPNRHEQAEQVVLADNNNNNNPAPTIYNRIPVPSLRPDCISASWPDGCAEISSLDHPLDEQTRLGASTRSYHHRLDRPDVLVNNDTGIARSRRKTRWHPRQGCITLQRTPTRPPRPRPPRRLDTRNMARHHSRLLREADSPALGHTARLSLLHHGLR